MFCNGVWVGPQDYRHTLRTTLPYRHFLNTVVR